MRILSKRTLREFWEIHEDCEGQLLSWYKEMKLSEFANTDELMRSFPNCRFIGRNRYIFNIKGNKYRLVVKINFDLQTVWVRFIGKHDAYDDINAIEI